MYLKMGFAISIEIGGLYGRGGFGKSEMVTELFSGPEFKDMVFVKSLK